MAPPFYFNFPILTELSGSDGIRPVVLDWKEVLMLSWIYTPYHLSSLVGKTSCFLNSLEVWQETNFLVDRALFGLVASKEKKPVVFLPYPSVYVRLHDTQVTREQAEIQKAGAALTVKRMRDLAEKDGIHLNDLWNRHRSMLKPATKSLFDTVARECLTTADLTAMGCDPHADARPWESPAADLARRQGEELKARLQSTRKELEKTQKTLAFVVAGIQTFVQRLLGAVDRGGKHPSRAAIESAGAAGATALAEANHEKANALHLDAAEEGAHLLQRLSPRWYRNWKTSGETVPGLLQLLGKVRKAMGQSKKPPVKQRLKPDLKHYSKAAGRVFSSSSDAVSHYREIGWHNGWSLHPLFDPLHFRKSNPEVDAESEPPWSIYELMLNDGKLPEAHPQFGARWLRDYFLSEAPPLPPQSVPLPEPPASSNGSKVLGSTQIVVGVILFHTDREELVHLFTTLRKAVEEAQAEGHLPPLIVLTDNSHRWNAADVEEMADRARVNAHFHPTSSNIGFGAGHNFLMRHAFQVHHGTHYLCLNPDGHIHPQALAGFYRILATLKGEALIEGLQFPAEHPKDYDAASHNTNWCSAACLLISKPLYEATGGFDERFFMYCEDVDLSWRVWEMGHRCIVHPEALFLHRVQSREPNALSQKWIFESGRILATKWQSRRFRMECERKLIEAGHYEHTGNFPDLEDVPKHVPHSRVDFKNHFTFAARRW
ncbi:hypothetical protein [Verrucomicrobium sp. BvORR106]|uniref:hypothetical protein n=1 Tax=Verrucomicrobium sp. BvORR106 TaxID=1403819 RepID=UPI00068CE882|nr:hypothetical protein [Verrucomicrobium sp. BvORR106]